MHSFQTHLLSVTGACTSENGCSKRYISRQGCPYTPPSDYFDEPKCFFDDSVEHVLEDPCDPYGDEEKEEDKDKDPSDKWDPTHKYKVFDAPTISKKVMHFGHLFKNAFVDICPPPNSYDIFGIIIGKNISYSTQIFRGNTSNS